MKCQDCGITGPHCLSPKRKYRCKVCNSKMLIKNKELRRKHRIAMVMRMRELRKKREERLKAERDLKIIEAVRRKNAMSKIKEREKGLLIPAYRINQIMKSVQYENV